MREFADGQVKDLVLGLTARAGLAMLFAALLAFLGPFSTYRFDVVQRIGYWTMLMAAWLILSLIAAGLASLMPFVRSRGAVARRVVTVLLASLPMLLVVGVANNMMSGWVPYTSKVIELYVSVLIIGGGYTYLADWFAVGSAAEPIIRPESSIDRSAPPPEVFAVEETPSDTALIDRLPPHIRADILCLQVEDHYVRVHSRHGSVMVLIRFSDALRGIDHIPGSQVHRSWWVAADAVESLRKNGRTAQLTLSNGTSVPVSQPYLAQALSTWGSVLI